MRIEWRNSTLRFTSTISFYIFCNTHCYLLLSVFLGVLLLVLYLYITKILNKGRSIKDYLYFGNIMNNERHFREFLYTAWFVASCLLTQPIQLCTVFNVLSSKSIGSHALHHDIYASISIRGKTHTTVGYRSRIPSLVTLLELIRYVTYPYTPTNGLRSDQVTLHIHLSIF